MHLSKERMEVLENENFHVTALNDHNIFLKDEMAFWLVHEPTGRKFRFDLCEGLKKSVLYDVYVAEMEEIPLMMVDSAFDALILENRGLDESVEMLAQVLERERMEKQFPSYFVERFKSLGFAIIQCDKKEHGVEQEDGYCTMDTVFAINAPSGEEIRLPIQFTRYSFDSPSDDLEYSIILSDGLADFLAKGGEGAKWLDGKITELTKGLHEVVYPVSPKEAEDYDREDR